jgi:hypothetical protein
MILVTVAESRFESSVGPYPSQSPAQRTTMRIRVHASFVLALLALLAPWQATSGARPAGSPANNKDKQQATARLRIELTGGDENKPLADASVYIKFQSDPKAQKGKQLELNLKTSQEGVALSPEIPQGRILIQVIAPGWKTYGQYFDIAQAEQTIPIHLSRPTTNYY